MTGMEDGEEVEVGDVNTWMRYFGSLPQDDDGGDD
jgi:hypothetical protein